MTVAPTDNVVVKVARDLTEMAARWAELHAQAIAHGSNPDIPGGDAMVALGPVANIELWANLNDTTEAYRNHPLERLRRSYTSEVDEDDDERWPPQQYVVYWAGRWRAQRGEDYPDLKPTGATEFAYIRQLVDWAAEHEPQFAAFANDIRRARVKLENLVHAGLRADRSRVVCDRDHCTTHPRLIRTYSPKYLTGWTCTTCTTCTAAEYRCTDHNHPAPASGQPCARMVGPRKERTTCGAPTRVVTTRPATCFNTRCPSFAEPAETWASDPTRDGWKCPACKYRYNEREHQRAHAKMLLRPEAERWVRQQEATATLTTQGRGLRTVRRWLAPRLELVDRCTECAAIWELGEYETCPALIRPEPGDEPEHCGGDLDEHWHGDAEAVVEGYCDISTHTTWLWWPDLWRLHLTTRRTATKTPSGERIGA